MSVPRGRSSTSLTGLALGAVLVAIACVAAVASGTLVPVPTLVFGSPRAEPDDVITVRTSETPQLFSPRQRTRPLQRPIRIYLVSNAVGAAIRTPYDQRLHYVASLVRDSRGRGRVSFAVPPLDSGTYAVAGWCPACDPKRPRRAFFVQRVGERASSRLRQRMLLRVETSPVTNTCPATRPNGMRAAGVEPNSNLHGNGFLWARLPPAGVLQVGPRGVEADGSVFEKMIWQTTGVFGHLDVQMTRLDQDEPQRRVETVSGSGGSWAARLLFSGEGCWRITGRIEDISLTFVMEVDITD